MLWGGRVVLCAGLGGRAFAALVVLVSFSVRGALPVAWCDGLYWVSARWGGCVLLRLSAAPLGLLLILLLALVFCMCVVFCTGSETSLQLVHFLHCGGAFLCMAVGVAGGPFGWLHFDVLWLLISFIVADLYFGYCSSLAGGYLRGGCCVWWWAGWSDFGRCAVAGLLVLLLVDLEGDGGRELFLGCLGVPFTLVSLWFRRCRGAL